MAAAAKIIDGTELNQQAMVAPDNFPGINRGKSGSHSGVGGARAGFPWNQETNQTRYLVPNLLRNLRDRVCGCQVKSGSHATHRLSIGANRRRIVVPICENFSGVVSRNCPASGAPLRTKRVTGFGRYGAKSDVGRTSREGNHARSRVSLAFTN